MYLTDCFIIVLLLNSTFMVAVIVSLCQTALQEGEKRRLGLQEALSHHVFLADCLKAEQTQRLEREASETLRETETHTASLKHRLTVRRACVDAI